MARRGVLAEPLHKDRLCIVTFGAERPVSVCVPASISSWLLRSEMPSTMCLCLCRSRRQRERRAGLRLRGSGEGHGNPEVPGSRRGSARAASRRTPRATQAGQRAPSWSTTSTWRMRPEPRTHRPDTHGVCVAVRPPCPSARQPAVQLQPSLRGPPRVQDVFPAPAWPWW